MERSEEITAIEQKSSWKLIHKKILTENETEMAKNKIVIITWIENETEMAENKIVIKTWTKNETEMAKNKISSNINLNWSSRHWSSGWNALEETSG